MRNKLILVGTVVCGAAIWSWMAGPSLAASHGDGRGFSGGSSGGMRSFGGGGGGGMHAFAAPSFRSGFSGGGGMHSFGASPSFRSGFSGVAGTHSVGAPGMSSSSGVSHGSGITILSPRSSFESGASQRSGTMTLTAPPSAPPAPRVNSAVVSSGSAVSGRQSTVNQRLNAAPSGRTTVGRTGTGTAIVNNRFSGSHDRFFDRDFHDHFFHGHNDFAFLWWSPWFWNGWYPGLYGYGYPWYYNYGYDYYPRYYYDYGYAAPVSNTYNYYNSYQAPSAEAEPAAQPENTSAGQWYTDAVTQFRQGDYREALRLASHGAIDAVQDAKIHELISLCLFALGDYRGASMEAHAALSLGPPANWPALYGYYEDLPKYTGQLEALEKFSGENPSSLDSRFLLGYHHLMMGHTDVAKQYFADVVAKAPQDKLAAELAKGAAIGPPAKPATKPAPKPAAKPATPQAPPAPAAY